MCEENRYRYREIYNHGIKEWVVYDSKKSKDYHAHVKYSNKNAAKMICIRAQGGVIPKDYPNWMVVAINRLWYGKNFESRQDLNLENLYVKDESVRIKRKQRRRKYPVKRSARR